MVVHNDNLTKSTIMCMVSLAEQTVTKWIKLGNIQRLACVRNTKAMRTTPTTDLSF